MPRQTLKQRPDGRYACKFQNKWFYGYTQGEALAAREAYKRMLESGLVGASENVSVQNYARNWLPVHKANVSSKTYNDCAKALNVLCEFVGDYRLKDVRPTDIKTIYSTHYAGMSDSHIRHAKNLFVALFDSAVEDGLCRINPCRSSKAQPHKGTVGTHRAITDEERQLILTTPHRMQPAAMAMLYAGLRRGEALALSIDRDVDFKAMTLTVRQGVHFESNQPIVADHVKTDAGLRTIPMFLPLAAMLKNQHGLLMPNAKGAYCSETAFRRAWDSYMLALSNAAGKPIKIQCHDLRHTFCTMLRLAGVDLKTAMLWMGHADESMILKIYDHITDERVRQESEKVSKMLSCSQIGSQF